MKSPSIKRIEEIFEIPARHYQTIDVLVIKRGDKTVPLCGLPTIRVVAVPNQKELRSITCVHCLRELRRDGHITASQYLELLRKIQ